MTEDLRFNTAISQMMVFVNEMNQLRGAAARACSSRSCCCSRPTRRTWPRSCGASWATTETAGLRALARGSIPRYLVEDTVTVVVQVNGKVRDQLEVPADSDEDGGAARPPWPARRSSRGLEGKKIVKTIYVPGKLLGLVVR